MENNKNIVETVDQNGKTLKLMIKIPGHKILQEAQMVYNLKLTSLIRQSASKDSQLLSRQQLDQHLERLGIWTSDDAEQFVRMQLELRELELKLKTGGIKVTEAKKIALSMKIKRAILLALYNRRAQFEEITMESIANNQKFKFLITKCVTDTKTNRLFFENIDDYESRQDEPAAMVAATALAGQIYGYDDSTEANLSENQWLRQFNFADNQGRLINKDGHLIDTEGYLVNEEGRFVNSEDRLVDNQGRSVDEDGNFVINTKPFLDDKTGEPIITKPKRKKKSKKN